MKISVTVEGAQENIEALRQFKEQTPAEFQVALAAGMKPIVGAMKQYPPQPPYMGAPTTGRIVSYRRTGNYGARITGPYVEQHGNEIVGYINSGASYSTYLRGDLAGYPGAYMHIGIWQTLTEIIAKLLPQTQSRIERQLSSLINRLGLGE